MSVLSQELEALVRTSQRQEYPTKADSQRILGKLRNRLGEAAELDGRATQGAVRSSQVYSGNVTAIEDRRRRYLAGDASAKFAPEDELRSGVRHAAN